MSIREVLEQLAAAHEKIDEARTHLTNADTTINGALGLLHAAADSQQDAIQHATAQLHTSSQQTRHAVHHANNAYTSSLHYRQKLTGSSSAPSDSGFTPDTPANEPPLVRRELPELTEEIRGSFAHEEYILKDIEAGTVVYRAGNVDQPTGHFFGEVKPLTRADAEDKYYLEAWGNRREVVSTYRASEDITVYYGDVAHGTGRQYLVPYDVSDERVVEVFEHISTEELRP